MFGKPPSDHGRPGKFAQTAHPSEIPSAEENGIDGVPLPEPELNQ